MKKIIVLCLSIIMLFSLCACSLTETKADSYIDRIYQCSSSDYKEKEKLTTLLDKYGEDDAFVNAVVERVKTEDLDWSINLLEKFTDSGGVDSFGFNPFGFDYYNETIREAFWEKLYATRDLAFQNSEDITFDRYLDKVCDYGKGGLRELKYYFPEINDCLPYDTFKTYIVENYDVAITKKGQGGYYDGKEDNKSSSIQDPLGITDGSSYELGTYQSNSSTKYAGDFRLRSNSKTWWGTDSSDSNNTSETTLSFRGEEINLGYPSEKQAFMNLISSGTTYYSTRWDGTADMFFVVKENSISICDYKLVTVQYS